MVSSYAGTNQTVPMHMLIQKAKENKVDLEGLLLQIRGFVSQAEDVIQKVGRMTRLDLSDWESSFVTCPYNPTHRMSPEALFKHTLCCPANLNPRSMRRLSYPLFDTISHRVLVRTLTVNLKLRKIEL
jgi:hypothetical protein